LVESFDDSNTERLRAATANNNNNNGQDRKYDDFGFDPKCIDWDDYFYRVHIPGVVKYLCD
jgi:fatty acyl-CoA reductase